MADPEGGEFCLFVREQVPKQKLYEVVVDSADHAAQACWWHDVLGGRLQHNENAEDAWSWLEDVPGMPFECLVFGAGLLRPPDDEISWSILLDPEGNEFCVFG